MSQISLTLVNEMRTNLTLQFLLLVDRHFSARYILQGTVYILACLHWGRLGLSKFWTRSKPTGYVFKSTVNMIFDSAVAVTCLVPRQ